LRKTQIKPLKTRQFKFSIRRESERGIVMFPPFTAKTRCAERRCFIPLFGFLPRPAPIVRASARHRLAA
jgi:hypothetical protein